MIKTIIASNIEELDKKVNEFMKDRKGDLPVRTEVYTLNRKVWHKATIFYNEDFQGARISEIINRPEEKKETRQDTGALWIRGNAISGVWKNKKYAVPESLLDVLKENGYGYDVIDGEDVYIMKNKFKKTGKHPDFVIMHKKEMVK